MLSLFRIALMKLQRGGIKKRGRSEDVLGVVFRNLPLSTQYRNFKSSYKHVVNKPRVTLPKSYQNPL